MEKMVTIPDGDDELKEWNSFYNCKKRNDPNYASRYQKAIRRPRADEELIYEIALPSRGATKSYIQTLEVVMLNYLSSLSSCCICPDGIESKSIALLAYFPYRLDFEVVAND